MQLIKDPRFFPTILIVLDLLAACNYWRFGGLNEWRMVVYWLAAATLTFTVTW